MVEAGWDREGRCRPCYRLQHYGPFAERAWALWCMVGRGEITNAETGETAWSIDWSAFREARETGHDLTLEDDPAELFEAMVLVRSYLNRPTGEMLLEAIQEREDGGGD